MVTYQLVNLDLGENPIARDFDVGPYHIRLVDDCDEIQSKLSQFAKIPFDQPGVDWIDAKAGEAIITATAQCQDEPPSLFYSDDTPAIYDVQHILSYLWDAACFFQKIRGNTGTSIMVFPSSCIGRCPRQQASPGLTGPPSRPNKISCRFGITFL